LSESVLGEALADVPRQSYYIGTKVGRYEKNVLEMFDFSKERVQRSVRESLARLKLDYVDIIQVQVGRVTCGV
jgi:L-galactose dehydrogenase